MKTHPTFAILEEIGRGSAATVYRAWDLGLRRYVAVKELHEQFQGDARQMEALWEEAQFLANLKHDNIVQIHGLDKERGWIIMELMQGSLDARIAEEPLPADLVRSVLRQTLNALDTLHRRGQFHGGVWPGNLLVNEQGRVKLSDSTGIALADEIRRPTGSAKHLAPELLRPEFGPVGTQVDLYGLGLAALEMLKGPGFAGLFKGVSGGDPELAWMRWHSSAAEVLPPLTEVVPGVPPDLARVVDRLLRKPVRERYATAAEALRDLDDRPLVLVETARTAPRKPAPPSGPAVRPLGAAPTRLPQPADPRGPRAKPPAAGARHRWRTVVFLGLVGMILFAAVGLGIFWPGAQEMEVAPADPSGCPDAVLKHADKAKDAASEQRGADTRMLTAGPDVAVKERDATRAAWNWRTAMSPLAAVVDPIKPASAVPPVWPGPHDFTRPVHAFDSGGLDGFDLIVSRDGAYLAGVGCDPKAPRHEVYLWDLRSGKLVRKLAVLTKEYRSYLRACFSADSKSLFFGVNDLLSCYAVPEGALVWSKTLTVRNQPLCAIKGLALSQDGTRLRVATEGWEALITVEPRNGGIVSEAPFDPPLGTFYCFCLEGTHALYTPTAGDLRYAMVDLASMKETGGMKWTKHYLPLSLSVAGDWIAGWSYPYNANGGMDVWKASSGQMQWSIAGPGGRCATFSPDGKWLLRDDVKTLCLHNAATGATIRTMDHPDSVVAITFLPDGRHAVTSCLDRKIRVWQVLE
jgi:hypothetical protein